MTDLLQTGAAFLAARRKAHRTQRVIYVRGGASVELSATIGETRYWEDPGDGHVRLVRARDFIVDAADLNFGGAPIVPEPDDRIMETHDDATMRTYVVAPYNDEPCWRWADGYHRVRRIHSKLIRETAK
jgi:hypothetical protein